MIGKIMKAALFKRCVQYVTGKEDAKILASDGVLLTSTQGIIDSFEFQRQLNPRISKPVGHIALSFLPEDKDILTDEMMTRIAMDYMELMGIKNTQFLLVRHFDNGNPHCHLVYNRISNEGKTISDQNDFRRNEQVTKLLKRKYGLTFSNGKGNTKNERLRGNEKTRYEVYHIVMNTLAQATSWREFTDELRRNGVEMDIVVKKDGSTKIADIQGLRFTKDGKTFKASQIRRGMTYTKMDNILKRNAVRSRRQEPLISSKQAKVASSDKNKDQSNRSVMMNLSSTLQVHPFSFRHWDCLIQPTLSMTQMMKPSVVAYNKRRKRNEGQGYNGKISELRRVAYIATPTPQYMESSKCCAPSVVTILALIHLEKIGI